VTIFGPKTRRFGSWGSKRRQPLASRICLRVAKFASTPSSQARPKRTRARRRSRTARPRPRGEQPSSPRPSRIGRSRRRKSRLTWSASRTRCGGRGRGSPARSAPGRQEAPLNQVGRPRVALAQRHPPRLNRRVPAREVAGIGDVVEHLVDGPLDSHRGLELHFCTLDRSPAIQEAGEYRAQLIDPLDDPLWDGVHSIGRLGHRAAPVTDARGTDRVPRF
jgi:hypothetical protein